MDFTGQNVIVTGAAQGIGQAIAVLFARKRARVAIVDRNADGAESAAAAIREAGGQAVPVECDATAKDQIADRFDTLLGDWGQIHVLVNNAGTGLPGTIEDIAEPVWDMIFRLNVNTTLLCTQAVIPGMKAAGYGRIINIASLAGRSKSVLAGLHYGASKAAVIGLTRNLATDMGPHGITVNAICPGPVATPLAEAFLGEHEDERTRIPLGRWGAPEDVAGAALFLASPYASYITGICLDVNGGQFMA